MTPLDDLKAHLEEAAEFVMPVADAMAKGLCCACGKPALERCYSDAGRREYRISGLCEVCFDECCAEPEEAP